MREAFQGLTVRGRAFLAAGVTAMLCAVTLGQSSLIRVGLVAVGLPIFTALVIGRGRYKLALVRTVSPLVVTAGQSAEVTLTITNEGRTPSGSLMLEDHLPYILGTRPRFVMRGVRTGWRRQVSYLVRSEVRGRFNIGPMTVRVGDPFGLVELGRAFRSHVPLTVTPRTVPLPTINLAGGWTGSGDNRPRAFATGSAEDVTVREYRHGDDLRRVHWRSSARVGELMVRREEQPWQSRATLYLDNRKHAHRGHGVASSLETAVTATASIAVHLSKLGYHVRLATAAGVDNNPQWHVRDAERNTGAILEALAVVEAADATLLDTSWLGEHAHGGGLTIAVLGELDDADFTALRRIHHQSSTALAAVLDVARWTDPEHRSDGHLVRLLNATGWRAADLGPQDRLDAIWQELGKTSGGTSLSSQSAGPYARSAR